MHLFSKEALDFKGQARNLGKVQNIAMCGLFIALYIVLSYFNIKISESIEIRFAFLILALAGYYGGPVMGMTVGIASDILSMLLTGGQGSAFNLGFTFDYALIGFLFGLVLYRNRITVLRMIGGEFTHYFVCITLHTLWLGIMYGMPLKALAISRLVKCTLTFPIYVILLYLVLKAFSEVAVRAGILQEQRA